MKNIQNYLNIFVLNKFFKKEIKINSTSFFILYNLHNNVNIIYFIKSIFLTNKISKIIYNNLIDIHNEFVNLKLVLNRIITPIDTIKAYKINIYYIKYLKIISLIKKNKKIL